MLLIPELETVVILVPRTGTGSLYRAVLDRYPRAIMPYRHMEADGVPHGYDRWRRVGVVRNPLDRLWSLYRFLRDAREPIGLQARGFASVLTSSYAERRTRQVELPFSEWLLQNHTVFTGAHDDGKFWPQYAVLHAMPETQKSQFVYLRPDLGTVVYRYRDISALHAALKVSPERINATQDAPIPRLTLEASRHMDRVFAWDNGAF